VTIASSVLDALRAVGPRVPQLIVTDIGSTRNRTSTG
jgi:hypothetical protein